MKLLRVALIALLLCPLASLAEGFVLPSFEQVRASHVSSDSLLLDRKGQPLADLRLDPKVRRLDWVPLAQLSPSMRDALLRAEDRRFFQHSGVDWLAFAGAAWQNLWGSSKRGASTLTMQLAGLLDPALRMPASRRSVSQKWDQSRMALELEEKWNKPQILEAYLNLAPFRGDLQGIAAASELIFGLPAHALSIQEASLLAALLRGPNASPPQVAKRACRLASSLGQRPLCARITQLAHSRLDAPRNAPRHQLAPHLARRLLLQPGQRVSSVLDAALQSRLLKILSTESDPRTALLVLDNNTADILAWIGGADPLAADGVTQPRILLDWWWPASAALAIERGEWTAASPLPLGAVIFDPRDALAAPQSWMSLRSALLNHQHGALLGLHARHEREHWQAQLQKLGFEPTPETRITPNLLELAAAWRSLATGGWWQAPRWLPGNETAARRAWRKESSYILQDMLGTYTPQGWQASWSSRSSDDGSLIMIGHTERHTLALSTHSPGAQALWQSLIAALGIDSRAPAMPEGVACAMLSFDPPAEPARRECFLRGTELTRMSVLPDGQTGRIDFPQTGLIYDVAAASHTRERWILHASSSVALRWQLNGHALGEGQTLYWQPVPGTHRLSISDPQDRPLHSIDFEIRTTAAPAYEPEPHQP